MRLLLNKHDLMEQYGFGYSARFRPLHEYEEGTPVDLEGIYEKIGILELWNDECVEYFYPAYKPYGKSGTIVYDTHRFIKKSS